MDESMSSGQLDGSDEDVVNRLNRVYSERKADFLKLRTEQEVEFAEYSQFIKSHASYFKGKVDLPEEFSLKAMIPELYEDEPDEAVYQEQLQKTAELFRKINAVQIGIGMQSDTGNGSADSQPDKCIKCDWDDEAWDKARKDYAERYSKFIQHRTAQEMAVAEFGRGIKANAEIFKDKVEIPDVFTLEALIPELYKESPDEAVYYEQYDKAVGLFNSIYEVMNDYIAEVEKCLQEYNVLSSSRS